MTKLNIHAQSIQNPFANISSRIYFSYWLIVKGIKKKKKPEKVEGEEAGCWGGWGGGGC